MANPIIDSITVSPDPVPTGQTTTITVVAHDPDQRTETFTVIIRDVAGNEGTGQVDFNITDPLTYEGSVTGGTVTHDGAGVFMWSE